MTDLEPLFARLRAADIRLTIDGDRLAVNAPRGALTAELREELAGSRDAIKAHLRARAEAQREAEAGIRPVPRTMAMPVSHAQQRLWFLRQFDPDSAAYNVVAAFRLRGPLDVAALEYAIAEVVRRHESLRTALLAVDGAPVCRVAEGVPLALERFDVSTFEPAAQDEAIRAWLVAFARRPFDMATPPLLRAALIHVAPAHHVFTFVVDHLVADGVSVGILLREIEVIYRAARHGQPHGLPDLPVQYVDYVTWQQQWLTSGAIDEARAFWREQLRAPLAVIQLPSDRRRSRAPSGRGATVAAVLPRDLSDAVRTLARREGGTPYMVILAAFQALIARYTGETDVPVGTAIANRHRAEAAAMVGFFANNLVMRGDLSGNPTLREVLARVRPMAAAAYAHQEMPFDVLVDLLAPPRTRETSPLFQVMLVLHGSRVTHLDLDALEAEVVEVPTGTARFDLAVDVFDHPEGFGVRLEYATDLFDEAQIARLADHYRVMLEAFATTPDVRVGDVPLVGPDTGLEEVCAAARGPSLPAGEASTVPALFVAQVARTPSHEALRFGAERLTYAALDARANQLAWVLRARGVGPDALVGIWMDRSVEMVVAVLAVLKAGGAYVPLDPAFPADRLTYMATVAGLTLILTQSHLRGLSLPGVELFPVDTSTAELAAQPSTEPPLAITPDHLAYVLYTSGSTGQPKGVQITHAALVNFLRSMHADPGIGPSDRLVAVTTLSFDIAGLELHGPLTVGGTVVLADRATAIDGHALADLLRESEATILQATPATWRLLLEAGWTGQPGLKMLCGGEALPRDLADRLLTAGAGLWNLYGPTETTIWSTLTRVTAGAPLTIGRPIAETTAYVMTSPGVLAPPGVVGELWIGGAGLARGYRHRPTLTAEKFVTLAVTGDAPERLYRTGDLVRMRGDGQIEFVGRRDHQVKLRGFRIELGEIEAALLTQPGVRQAVVAMRPAESGQDQLVAYLVADAPIDGDGLRAALRRTLPDYMVPAVCVPIDVLPLTPNGKVDRQALPAPVVAARVPPRAPANATERDVAGIWADVLKVASVPVDANFFDLGGHSLLLAQVQNRVTQVFGRQISMVELFEAPTVAGLAARLAGPVAASQTATLARDRMDRQRAALGRRRPAAVDSEP